MNTESAGSIWLLLCFIFAVTVIYAILNNLVAINVSPEFFREILPKEMNLSRLPSDPIAASITMGIIGSWWLGILFAVAVSSASRFGARRKLEVSEVAHLLFIPLIIVFFLSHFFGWLFFQTADVSSTVPEWVERFGEEKAAAAFHANAINSFAYLLGALVAVGVSVQAWRIRIKPKKIARKNNRLGGFFNSLIGSGVVTAVISVVLVLFLFLLEPGLSQVLFFVALAAFFFRIFFDLKFVYLRLGFFALGAVLASLTLTSYVGEIVLAIIGISPPDLKVNAFVYLGLIAFAAFMMWLHFLVHNKSPTALQE